MLLNRLVFTEKYCFFLCRHHLSNTLDSRRHQETKKTANLFSFSIVYREYLLQNQIIKQ